MTFIIILLSLLLTHSSIELNSPLFKSLIQRRQILDGTAKSDGVAPEPPGSDNAFRNNAASSLTQQSTLASPLSTTTTTTTPKINNELTEDRSIKDTASSNASSKAGLIASIVAPTGLLGLIGAAVDNFFYKKNQTNAAAANDTAGFFNNFFSGNSNAIIENKSEEIYLLVGNIS